jgi:hypothetical protein
MFEKPDQDYIHYFCLTDPAAHRDWVRAILNARTYILRQDRAILFQMDASQGEAAAHGGVTGGGVSRGLARRVSARAGAADTGNGATSPAPLIDSAAFAGPFVKGSLLADKAIRDAKGALRDPPAQMSAAMADLSLLDRNTPRPNDARRREEAIEWQRCKKADAQPLINLSEKRR